MIEEDIGGEPSGYAEYTIAENAVTEFKAGEHEVFPDLSGDIQLPYSFEGNDVFCRIIRDGESGDSSVGIPSWEAWTLAENQTGTMLEKFIEMSDKIKQVKTLLTQREYFDGSDSKLIDDIKGILGR